MTNDNEGERMARYGLMRTGEHAGEYTLCHARDMASCPYHSEHVDMTAAEAMTVNEPVIERRQQHAMPRAMMTPRRFERARRMAGAVLAITALTTTLAACGNTSESPANVDDGTPGTAESYARLKSAAKGGVDRARSSRAASRLRDKLTSSDTKAQVESMLGSLKSGSRDAGESDQSQSSTSSGGASAFGSVSAAQGLADLNALRVEGPSAVGYDRSEWRQWDVYGSRSCWSVREQTIATQATGVRLADDGCSIEAASLTSPYTGSSESFGTSRDVSSRIQIDHVVPLKYAAEHGAQSWSAADKERYANDTTPGHLIAVDSHSNEAKGDSGPSEWMPSANQCAYVEDFVGVLRKWSISISPADATFAQRQLASCR